MLQHHIKIIGSNGQLSLGKTYAGKLVMVDKLDEGTWLVKAGTFIPDAEKWLYENNHLASLETALDWANENKPKDNFNQLTKKISHD